MHDRNERERFRTGRVSSSYMRGEKAHQQEMSSDRFQVQRGHSSRQERAQSISGVHRHGHDKQSGMACQARRTGRTSWQISRMSRPHRGEFIW